MDSVNFNTTYNTLGIGDVIPPSNHSLGSGDRFDNGKRKKSGIYTQKAAQQINWAAGIPSQLPYVVYKK